MSETTMQIKFRVNDISDLYDDDLHNFFLDIDAGFDGTIRATGSGRSRAEVDDMLFEEISNFIYEVIEIKRRREAKNESD